jgi:adhesin transport system membrane fusion protein
MSTGAGVEKTSGKQSTDIFAHGAKTDLDLIHDIRTTILIQSPKGGRTIVWLTLVLMVILVFWASVSQVEEVTRGNGKVIPSSQIQVIQNLEGGILAEIHVHVGDIVQKGQLLMRLDATRFSAPYEEFRSKYLALHAQAARLKAEISASALTFPEEVTKEKPEIAERERQLFESRKHEIETRVAILEDQMMQRQQELAELREKSTELARTYSLLNREINLTQPLIKQGAVSEVEVLRLQREASALRGEIAATRTAIPRAESAIRESSRQIEKERLTFANEAKKEYNEIQSQLEGLSASASALVDRLDRTAVRSPVYGTVKQVLVNTVGGVVQPGMDLVEIVPLEDTLLVEAQIKPADIAFLTPKQRAMVKFTAYDFTIYGGLEAELEYISADSTTDPQGNSYYLVRVRTKKSYLEGKSGQMPIIPGMVATVDIVTGKKTILSYLLKPVLRAKQTALRER